MGLVRSLLAVLGQEIVIDVSPDAFTFRSGSQTLVVPTYVVVRVGPDGPRIVSVGEPADATGSSLRVDLFKDAGVAIPNVDRQDLFEAYLTHVIRRFHGRRRFVRPHVDVTNWHQLQDALCGYERMVLAEALSRAGARSIGWRERS